MAEPKSGRANNNNGSKPLLDLSTLDVVEYINIDGKRYEFVNIEALPLRQRIPIANAAGDCIKLLAEAMNATEAKPLSAAKEKKLDKSVTAAVRLIVPGIPPAVLDKLNSVQKQDIVTAFLFTRRERAGNAEVIARMVGTQSTGVGLSQDSSGSTAARPNRGTRRSRQRSSGRTQ